MRAAREQRKLAAILAADVVGYSRLMGRDESGTLARFRSATEQRKHLVQDRTNATSRPGSEESAVGGKPDMRQTSQNRRK
jgi:class 3 adenylate cyclase